MEETVRADGSQRSQAHEGVGERKYGTPEDASGVTAQELGVGVRMRKKL